MDVDKATKKRLGRECASSFIAYETGGGTMMQNKRKIH